MRLPFYDSLEYKQKQAEITRKYWLLGRFNFRIKALQERKCKNPKCQLTFQVKPHDSKMYCGRRCAALVNSPRKSSSLETRQRISSALRGKPNPYKGTEKVPRQSVVCQNPDCKKVFKVLPYLAKIRKFCSNTCVMHVIGSQTTSPKASKGKPGIRSDIDPNICFYSTWEANIARVFNLVNIKWQYAPRIFKLGIHTYRPDFYLPEENKFIEIKNFMNDYSRKRDSSFRKLYPNITLEVISKEEYKEIEKHYKPLINSWE